MLPDSRRLLLLCRLCQNVADPIHCLLDVRACDTQVGQLAPVPKDIKFGEVPAGVKVLGGTYAIDGDAVTFSHMDVVPGATPEIDDVLSAVGA